MKSKSFQKSSTGAGKTRAATLPEPERTFELTNLQLLGATLVVAALYFAWSYVSNGFYQHDEVGHFANMRDFWHDPSVVLGNWAKPGYKLLYAIPALGGATVVLVVNCLVAAFTCWAAYALARAAGARTPLFAFVLLAFQPFWMQLAFRNYSEYVSALLLVLAVLAHYKDRDLIAALLLSYGTMIRQEFFPLLALFGLYLLYRRQFLAAAALALFPVLNNLWGWAATGDPLYLWTSTFSTGSTYQSAYPRQGFDHYLVTSLIVFGASSLTLLFAYAGELALRVQRWHPFIILPAALYLLEHLVFNLQALPIGPSTGGNLRYMIVIAPLVAVLGALAADRLPRMERRTRLLWALGPLVLLAALFMSYHHNNVVLLKDRFDPVPLLFVVAMSAGVLILRSRAALLALVLGAGILYAAVRVEPMKLSAEDETVRNVAAWSREQKLDRHPLLVNHPLFFYYYGRSQRDFPRGAAPITGEAVMSAPLGTVILWDSHYSYRPELRPDQVQPEFFIQQPEAFRPLLQPVLVREGNAVRFAILGFEKIGEPKPVSAPTTPSQ